MLQAGIGEIDITPHRALRVAGMPQPPVVQQAQWPLYGRVFLFADGSTCAAVVTLDVLFLWSTTVAEYRQAISAAVQPEHALPPENILIACTHTHRAPHTTAIMDEDADFDYLDEVKQQLTIAARQAAAALRPVHLRTGQMDAPGWNHNRRSVYQTPTGSQVGTHGATDSADFLAVEGPVDTTLQVLALEELNHHLMGGLVSYACHPTVMANEKVYSADYPGALIENLKVDTGGTFGFLQGCAGNLSPSGSGLEYCRRMGAALSEKACEAIQNSREIASNAIHVAREVLSIPQRKVTLQQVNLAKWYLEKAPVNLDQKEYTRWSSGHDFTFYHNDPVIQEWFARETIGMWEWQRRSGLRQPVEQIEIMAFSLGESGFVALPGEIFTEYSSEIHVHSPFQVTFPVETANGWHGYIPTRAAFPHGGYETRLGYTSRLVEDAGERMMASAIELLKKIHLTDKDSS